MLRLEKINKIYEVDKFNQQALKNINITFRENEFVSILGPSGSGKTTLLNIIGGLDKYTSGDLLLNGKSTKEFNDKDWDSYRNTKIGFVFQSYNLIPHQSILANVELALTLSSTSKSKRKKIAKEALEKVGLKEHITKKPSELSGGQMQRVAIARSLVNNPDILLADEPTGALDSKTSTQIMDLLKEVAKDRLVIMVTHNRELAEEYSTRIIELKDGQITKDTNEYTSEEQKGKYLKTKVNMSFKTAFNLSLNNLLTKKGRTILTAFAGSIGIIGIALIMSLSNGVESYISKIEEETLTSYPLTIDSASVDITTAFSESAKKAHEVKEYNDGKIHSKDTMMDMMSLMSSKVTSNNLEKFKKYLEAKKADINDSVSAISYGYNLELQLYKDTKDKIVKVNPNTILESMGLNMNNRMYSNYITTDVFTKMLDNEELNNNLYTIIAGHMPSKYNEVVLYVNKNNEISDYTLYALGLKDQSELKESYAKIASGEEIKVDSTEYTYDELLGLKFKFLLNSDYYQKQNSIWVNKENDEKYMRNILKNAETIEVVGIIKPSEEATISNSLEGCIFYTKDLEEYIINKTNDAQIIKDQKNNPTTNVITGLKFTKDAFDINNLNSIQKKYFESLSTEELANAISEYQKQSNSTYESVLSTLGAVDLNVPSQINIYAKDFESKDYIKDFIAKYNENVNDEADIINYSDIVGILMSSVTKIVDIISYVLISFVSISLVVSSIMIGIITYISVLERTKEIGILRALGASKKDIANVFNAETLIIGIASGIFGIGITLILNIPISIIIEHYTSVIGLCKLPISGAIFLIIISALLTLIGGLIPARMASKKDPVIALRSE